MKLEINGEEVTGWRKYLYGGICLLVITIILAAIFMVVLPFLIIILFPLLLICALAMLVAGAIIALLR